MGRPLPFISIVMPCLNEEKTVGICVTKAQKALSQIGYPHEIVVCDNGSTDKSAQLAKGAGARVIFETQKGYGSAYLTGIKAAKGEWLIIGDSDDTYSFLEASKFIKPLQAGYDLVLGSRLNGKMAKKSMPLLNRFLGTPVLNMFLKLFYGIKLSDSQSGMRALTKKAFRKMKLKTLGMEFASEMLVRASQENLRVTEVPISYGRRIAPSKLSRFRDAWRHLRFMLLFAPTWLFLIPGSIIMAIGLFFLLVLARGPFWLFGRALDLHSLILASMLTLLGYQIFMLGIYAKAYSWVEGFNRQSRLISTTLRYFRLEKGIALGVLISLFGFLIGLVHFINWANQGFGQLVAVRPAVLAMTLFILGIQIVFSSFFLSVLGIEKK